MGDHKSYVKYELTNGKLIYRGDTMTSAWVPIKNYIKLMMHVQTIPEQDMWELYFFRNTGKIELPSEAGRFLQLTHSVGNFIPVPEGFNKGRSGEYAKWDFWDLTLNQIFMWYNDNADLTKSRCHDALNRLFTYADDKDVVGRCEAWLEMFGTWENFIKENYLEAFINEQGMPKVFFFGHSLDDPLPKTFEEFETFFKNVNECIEQRGKQIVDMSK